MKDLHGDFLQQLYDQIEKLLNRSGKFHEISIQKVHKNLLISPMNNQMIHSYMITRDDSVTVNWSMGKYSNSISAQKGDLLVICGNVEFNVETNEKSTVVVGQYC